MKKLAPIFGLCLITLFVCDVTRLLAQDIFEKTEAKRVKDKLYLSLTTDTTFQYSIENPDKPISLKTGVTFSLKDDLLLYIEWLNPLLYSVNVQDSVFNDPAAIAADEFLGSVVSLFNPASAIASASSSSARPSTAAPLAPPAAANPIVANFTDLNLIVWKLMVNERATDAQPLKSLSKALERVDSLLAIDFQSHVNSTFEEFKKIQDPSDVLDKKGSYKNATDGLEQVKKLSDKTIEAIAELNKISIDNIVLGGASASSIKDYTKAVVAVFLKGAEPSSERRKKDYEYLKGVQAILEKSISKRTHKLIDGIYYHVLKEIHPERNKINKIFVELVVFKYQDVYSRKVLSKKKYSFITEKYQIFLPMISTGVFYSALDKRTFETSTDDVGNTIVAEAEQKSGPVTAIMLNYVVNSNKMPFLPFLQLGIDPTKERPFLLLGGGLFFSGLSKKFSISSGLAWTWRQHLETLSIGSIVSGTQAIKDDITYEFDEKPKGYVGLQYKF